MRSETKKGIQDDVYFRFYEKQSLRTKLAG
jgi:hypothetical protein